jgi:hypothetical protein
LKPLVTPFFVAVVHLEHVSITTLLLKRSWYLTEDIRNHPLNTPHSGWELCVTDIAMEVAGLVLAVYPATILAFEQYKKGAKYFSHWIQFRRRYESFIRDMEGQQLFFEGILQDLLCGGPNPYLIGGDSKDSFLEIVSDPNFTG